MASANTGPPWFADSPAEAAQALAHQQSVRRRAAFQAANQARLRGNPSKALQVLFGFAPVTGRR